MSNIGGEKIRQLDVTERNEEKSTVKPEKRRGQIVLSRSPS